MSTLVRSRLDALPRGAFPGPGDFPGPGAFIGLTVALSIETEAWETAGLGDAAAIEAMATATFVAVAARLRLPEALTTEIALTLADDETVKAANAQWRGKDKPTNILSFPMAELAPGAAPGRLAGDLLVAFETVLREANEEEKPIPDHLRHLLVHGFLHLLGFDHIEDDEAETMEALEVDILAGFSIADPYGVPCVAPGAATTRHCDG